ncbi:hypothetical protein INT43_007067 [Umbelopsis isabellina]|uniref:Uncharacterized protein n=1 Tax=Mortierella isabellina TaxID=91625 RepID=A0A8H7PYA5_MORIS|nr:hypothetical protein INT43_007067 [Umbelopsis isabellina]
MMMEEPTSNIAFNLKLQRSQTFQLRFDDNGHYNFSNIPHADFASPKILTPDFEYNDTRGYLNTEDSFSDATSDSTDVEQPSPEVNFSTSGLSPPPSMARKPSAETIPKSRTLSDRHAQCRLSFGLPSNTEIDDYNVNDDESYLAKSSMEQDRNEYTDLLQTAYEEQQEEITYCRDRIEQSKYAQDMMQTIHHRDEEINKMQTAMNRFRRLLKLKDNEIRDLLKIIQESC